MHLTESGTVPPDDSANSVPIFLKPSKGAFAFFAVVVHKNEIVTGLPLGL